jgi:predicted outer membrane repeat protein
MLGNGGTLVIKNGEIYNNRAQGGGGIAIYQGSICNFSGGAIYDNTADVAGGGVVVNLGGSFIMDGGVVRENKTLGSGGGFALLEGGVFTLKNGEVNGNSANEHGGGIAADTASTITVEGGFISANTAVTWGGGVFAAGPFTKTGGKIYGNDMPKDQANMAVLGPAVFVFGSNGTYKTYETSAGENLVLDASADDEWVIVDAE